MVVMDLQPFTHCRQFIRLIAVDKKVVLKIFIADAVFPAIIQAMLQVFLVIVAVKLQDIFLQMGF